MLMARHDDDIYAFSVFTVSLRSNLVTVCMYVCMSANSKRSCQLYPASDGEAPAQELCEIGSTSSILLLPAPLKTVWVPSIVEIDLESYY